MEGLELISFKIIASVGTARSLYIEAIQLAKAKDFDGAKKMVREGDKNFLEGHHAHVELIQQEANKQNVAVNLLLVHAEDQMMSADAFKIIANEFIDLYELIAKKEVK